eukprot:GFUD01120274.1.p1 GENE.GFUD01120274.1~~GFUD01120274.1.p1  ORF type:complete len:150 (-),score=31.61 GFUD01120274.1:103-519(-)
MSATTEDLEGDWQLVSDKVFSSILVCFTFQGYDPAKVTVKNIMGSDWMVACMLKRVEGGKFGLVKLNCSNKDTPPENKELEEELKSFLEKGITHLIRNGKNLTIEAGGQQKQLVEDDIRKQHEEAQTAKLQSGSGRFG